MPKPSETKRNPPRPTKAAASSKPNLFFFQRHLPTPALAPVVGKQPLNVLRLITRIYEYSQIRGLCDRQDRRIIHTDRRLKRIFPGRDQVSINELEHLLQEHFSK